MNALSISGNNYAGCRYAVKKTLFLFLLLTLLNLKTQAQNFIWANNFEGGTIGFSQAYGIAVDAIGNSYTVGYFSGTVDFDAGVGVYNMSSMGLGEDIFIQKTDASGNFVWAKNIGGTARNIARAVTLDAGYVYVTGAFSGTADFDPGAGVTNLSSHGGSLKYDIFVMKLDTAGNFVWAKGVGSTLNGGGECIAVDPSGNVYTGGYFESMVDFDPGAGVNNMTTIPANGSNGFVQKLDASGNFVWAKNIGAGHVGSSPSDNGSYVSAMSLDTYGNIYVAGTFEDTVDFDPGAGMFEIYDAYYNDASFVSKLDPSGGLIWVKMIGGSVTSYYQSTCSITAIATDNNNNVYITGDLKDTVDLDPGPGVYNVFTTIPTPGQNSFIEKLNSSGSFVWGQRLYSPSTVRAKALSVDASGYLYNVGQYTDSVIFETGSGAFSLVSPDTKLEYYILKSDTNGNFQFALQSAHATTTLTSISPCSVVTDQKRNIYVSGYFQGTYDFDPGTAVTDLSSISNGAVFIEKIDQTRFGADTAGSCGDFVFGGNTYTATGLYHDTLVSSIGSDSLLTLSLTVSPLPAAGTITGKDTLCNGGAKVTLTESVSGGVWSAANTHASVSTAGVVTGLTAGVDTLIYTVTNETTGCSATATHIITVNACVAESVADVHDEPLIRVAPNPNNGAFTVYFTATDNASRQMIITNTIGQKVQEFTAYPNMERQVSFDLPSGLYYLSMPDRVKQINTIVKIAVVR